MMDVISTASTTPPVTAADLDRFARLDSLGLTVTGQQIFPGQAVLFCQVTVPDDRCPGCGGQGRRHDTVLHGSRICRWGTGRPGCRSRPHALSAPAAAGLIDDRQATDRRGWMSATGVIAPLATMVAKRPPR